MQPIVHRLPQPLVQFVETLGAILHPPAGVLPSQPPSRLFEAKRGPQPAAEVGYAEHLYSEIGRLKIELEGLKKKSGLSLPR